MTPKQKENIIKILDLLTDEERLEIFIEYCTHCGTKQPESGISCQCWNDD